MRRFTTGDLEGVEAIKWLAFALMLLDHLARYALHGLGPLPWLLGRLVFPLFALALGFGLARRRAYGDLFLRLVVWGCVAQAAMLWAAPGTFKLNVLFTFACGIVIAEAAFSRRTVLGVLFALAALVASCAAEYGPVGALLVFAGIWYGRAHSEKPAHWPSALAFAALVLMLTPINGTAFAVLAMPAAWALMRWPVEIPRVPRLFYAGYVAQWCVVALAAWVLR